MRCFSRQGLLAASLNDIAKEAKMSAGLLYYYFKSKDLIIEAAFEYTTDETIDLIEHMLDRRNFVDAVLSVSEDAARERAELQISPGLHLEFNAEGARNPVIRELLQRRIGAVAKALAAAVDRAIAAGQVAPNVDKKTLVDGISLLWTGLATMRADPKLDVSRYQAAMREVLTTWTSANRQ